jgi:hypothetical protein
VQDYFSGENTIEEQLLVPYGNLITHTDLLPEF